MNTDQNWEATILVVDDEPDALQVLFDTLERSHFRVFAAIDGESALQQIAAMARPPDLILLDVMMPGIDGFETCRRFKVNAATRDIPVLFMTALSDLGHKVEGFEVGGADYITKPFQTEEVVARVYAHLTIRQQCQQLQAQNVQLQQQNALIAAQREQLRELNANKDKFFAILAHDLKNPLVSFLAFGSLLKQGLEKREIKAIKELAGQFYDSAKNVFTLFENLLTWAQLQREMLTVFPQEISIDAFAVRNLKLLSPNAEQKQITLKNFIQDEMLVSIDVPMIDTVVRNLLTNAVKFTNAGGTVAISATQDAQMVTMRVADTGIGIPAEKLLELFRIDARCQRAGTAGEQGTGLGLILCKEFVERNGGRIWAESEVGKGTTFTFTLPKKPTN